MSNTVASKLASKNRKTAPAKQVRLKLVYIDFWSAVKFSFFLSVCLAIVSVVSTILIYVVLLSTGVLAKIDEMFIDIVGEGAGIMTLLGFGSILAFAIVVGILNIIVGTAFGAVAATIYNLLVRALGGFQLGFTSS